MNLQSFYIGDYHAEVTMMLGEGQPSKDGRPAVVICPGGSYMYCSKRESEPVAYRFLEKGYRVFILNYSTIGTMIEKEGRTPSRDELYQIASMVEDDKVLGSEFPNPLIELALTLVFIRENCHEFNVNPDKIGVIGFSAGGHLAASLGVHWNSDWLKEAVGSEPRWFRPNYQVLSYPILNYVLNEEIANERGIGDPKFMSMAARMVFGAEQKPEIVERSIVKDFVNEDTPPTFVWHTLQDKLVFIQNSIEFVEALENNRVPWEFHTFNSGEHGLSLASEITGRVDKRAQQWNGLMFSWLEEIIH